LTTKIDTIMYALSGRIEVFRSSSAMGKTRERGTGSLTVRISRTAHATLRELAARADESMTEVLEKAIEAYRRNQFLNDLNASFEALRADPAAWADEQREREAWDATLADDLEAG
jgi:hypothetical protein